MYYSQKNCISLTGNKVEIVLPKVKTFLFVNFIIVNPIMFTAQKYIITLKKMIYSHVLKFMLLLEF